MKNFHLTTADDTLCFSYTPDPEPTEVDKVIQLANQEGWSPNMVIVALTRLSYTKNTTNPKG